MSSGLLKIAGGTVYDPAHGVDGQVRDVWIAGGKIVAAPTDPGGAAGAMLDARGLVVMPGGIDMHCHIAGPKTNAARKLRPEENRHGRAGAVARRTHSGTAEACPARLPPAIATPGWAIRPHSTRRCAAGRPARPCRTGRHALHRQGFLRPGRQQPLPARRDRPRASPSGSKAFSAGCSRPPRVTPPSWSIRAASKPGSTAAQLHSLDDRVPGFDTTPREIMHAVARAGNRLKLPHAVHIHTANLGLPGNWTTTLETMQTVEPFGGHLTHIQFHSYGGHDEASFCSAVAPLAEYVNEHPRLTVDVGQVMFGDTTSMTGDSQVGYYLSNLYGSRWVSHDTELETGCGITPIRYKQKSLINAWQWAIGLEWYLSVTDPWRVVMSTDHPNGGSFLAYPQIIRLLMDRTWRREQLAALPPQVRERSALKELDREYSLSEICIITRSGPARILGLKNKGHLGPAPMPTSRSTRPTRISKPCSSCRAT